MNLLRSIAGACAIATLASCSSSTNSPAKATETDGGPFADAATAIPTGLDIPTDKGTVHGSSSNGVRSFLGIPFAASTEGANRWKPPQPVTAWTTTRDATMLGPICPQLNPTSMSYDPTSGEDCLSVNVWTPDPAPTTPLPVMVWFFGGAFVFGSGGAAPYSGKHLVPNGNVVVVTLNYRVGPLGFLSHSALAAEDPTNASGNYGILDQRAALQWVQANIAAFGGDKNNVTIFGESAGGASVCIHLVSQGSRGLFHKAIAESGPCMLPAPTLADSEATGDRFAKALGCTDASSTLSCLRALKPDVVTAGPPNQPMQPGGLFYQDKTTGVTFQPNVDGRVLTDQPATLFANKMAAMVPVLNGANTSEGTLFHIGLFGDMPVMTDADYQAALTRTFGPAASTVAMQYPSSSFASPNDALTQVTADAFFVCQARRTSQLLAAAGTTDYLYSFNGSLSGAPLAQLNGKAFHSSELPYVFGDGFVLGNIPSGSQPLSDAIERYWTRFAKTGDPNGGYDPMWPAYQQASDQHLTLDQTIATGSGLEKAHCDFWDTLNL